MPATSDIIFSDVRRYNVSGDFWCVHPTTGCKFVIRNPDNEPYPKASVRFQHGHRCACPREMKGKRIDKKAVLPREYAPKVWVVWPNGHEEDASKLTGTDLRGQGFVFERWLDTAFYITTCKKALGFKGLPASSDDLPDVELVVSEEGGQWSYELRCNEQRHCEADSS